MARKTVTRVDLSEAVYQTSGLSRAESMHLVGQVLAQISETLAAGETVRLSGFGLFSVRAKSERMGRNLKSGEQVPIKPHRALTFKASSVLKARISRGQIDLTPRRRLGDVVGQSSS